MMFYVIARSYIHGKNWVNDKRRTDSEFNDRYPHERNVKIITTPDQLRGHNVEHGILLSGWKEHPNIKEILFLAMIHSQGTIPALKKAFEEVEQ